MELTVLILIGVVLVQLMIVAFSIHVGYKLGEYNSKIPKDENIFYKEVKVKKTPPTPYRPREKEKEADNVSGPEPA